MSVLFSCPTVTVAMGLPSGGGDPPAPGRGPGARRFRLHVGTETTVAFRAARRPRGTPGPVPWCAAGQPSAGHPFGPVDVAVPGARTAGFLTSVASVHPGTGRTSAGWSPVPACARTDPQTRARARVRTGASDLRRARPWRPGPPSPTGRGYVGNRHIIGNGRRQ